MAIAVLGLLTVAQSNAAQAAMSLQSFSLTDTFTNLPTASPSSATYDSTSPQFTVQAFDANLGTLTSTTVVWATTATFTGIPGTAGSSGFAGFSAGGNTYIDTISYGSGYGVTFSVNLASTGVTDQLLSSNADITYDSSILAAFIGPSSYIISYKNSGQPGNSPPLSITATSSPAAPP